MIAFGASVLRDAWQRLRSPIVPTVVALLVACTATTAVFATAGLGIAAQHAALDRINAPSGRVITVIAAPGSTIPARDVASVSALSNVEWSLGVGAARDVANTTIDGGTTVTSRLVFGEWPSNLVRDGSAPLEPGDAYASPATAAQLGLADGVGPVRGATQSAIVVGTFTAEAPLDEFADDLLIVGDATDSHADAATLLASVADVSELQPTVDAIRAVLTDSSTVRIEVADELASLGIDVTARLATTARWTVLGLVTAVALLMAMLQLGRVSALTKEIGRLRALGATRSLVVAQMLLGAAITNLLGAVAGAGIGVGIVVIVTGTPPTAAFCVAIIVLVLLAGVLGTIPPAVRAARLDPVAILRVP